MGTYDDVVDWARKMGYTGKLPPAMKSVYNASTAPIWAQIVDKVKPRQDVAAMRKNILVHQLSTDPARELKNYVRAPIKELDVWKKKQQLQKRLASQHDEQVKQKNKLERLSHENKTLHISIENMDTKIKENEGKAYVYQKKCDELIEEIKETEEKLQHCINLTPVETKAKSNKDIKGDLTKCAEKLEALISSQNQLHDSVDVSRINNSHLPSVPVSGKKCPLNSTTKRTSNEHLDESLGLISLNDIESNDEQIGEWQMQNDLNRLAQDGVSECVEDLLRKYHRGNIWETIRSAEDELATGLFQLEIDTPFEMKHKPMDEKLKFAKLHSIHILNQLKALKARSNIKLLEEQIKQQEEKLHSMMVDANYNNSKIEEVTMSISLKKEDVALSAAIACQKDGLASMRALSSGGDDIKVAHSDLLELQKNLVSNIKSLNYKINFFAYAERSIELSRNDTSSNIRKLSQFTEDFSWAAPLTKNLVSKETGMMDDFCLDFNRRVHHSATTENSLIYLRDYKFRNLPYMDNLTSDNIDNLAVIMDAPSSTPESIFRNIVADRRRLDVWNGLTMQQRDKCDFKLVELKEAYISDVVDRMVEMIRSSDDYTRLMRARVRECVRIWLEMPLKNFVSPDRLFQMQTYQHFDDLYQSIYSQLGDS